MTKPALLFVATLFVALYAPAQAGDNLVFVTGGVFKDSSSNFHGRSSTPGNPYIGRAFSIHSFYIGKYEVTQAEWVAVMGGNPSRFRGDQLPVESVSWYDCIEYCNRRSALEGLPAYYTIDREHRDPGNQNEIDPLKWTVTTNPSSKGYRLPTEAEWEYAAGGGQLSKGTTFSGGPDVDQVAWYYKNSGDAEMTGLWSWPAIERNHNRTQTVGAKMPNELGLYDMSGNVREWCWNWFSEVADNGSGPDASAAGRVWKGGGWLGGDFCCASAFRAGFEASGKGPDQGFRICRSE